MSQSKLNVAVIFGGRSAEHEVSLLSAANVMAAIPSRRYSVIPVGIRKDGSFVQYRGTDRILNATDARKVRLSSGGKSVTLFSDARSRGLVTIVGSRTRTRVDVAFPVLHGTDGEDGSIQGVFRLAGIPFVGAGVEASAIGMDKDVTKRLWRDAGLPTADFVAFHSKDREAIRYRDVVRRLGTRFFVKPASAGSSVGVHKVVGEKTFSSALDDAFAYGEKVLCEKMVKGIEIECSILGNEKPEASLPGIVRPTHDFYSYEAKYIDECGADFEIPAKLPSAVANKIRSIACDAYCVLGLEGMARVDGFLTVDQSFVLNEVNTIPGFTAISMYPKCGKQAAFRFPSSLTV